MGVAEVKELCAGYPGAVSKLFGPPGNVLVYYVGGTKFAYFKTSEPEQWRFSIRARPERFLELTDMPGIKPARYLARMHWVTIVDVNAVSADFLEALVTSSYYAACDRPRRGRRPASAAPRRKGSSRLTPRGGPG